jgi:hypothetical protein
MKLGKRKAPNKTATIGRQKEHLEKVMASIRAKVEHAFRVSDRRFEHVNFRYRERATNTAQLKALIALANL